MATITKMSRTKRLLHKDRLQRKLRKMKPAAHRADRRHVRQLLSAGDDVHTKPRMTPWDVV